MSILILGVGNILLSDEGVGVRVVEAFERRYLVPDGVEIVDGGTAGMDLLDIIEHRDHVIVVDAVRTGQPPGTVVRLAGDAVQGFFRTRISPHQLGLSEVLAALSMLDASPGGVTIIGVEPLDFSTSLDLSPTVAGRVDEMVGMVAAELAALGRPAAPHTSLSPSTATRWP